MVQRLKRPPDTLVALRALGNPQRVRLFEALCQRESTIEGLQLTTSDSYQNIRKHLRVLEEYKLVTSFKDGKYRYYEVPEDTLSNLHIWTVALSKIIYDKKFKS